MCAFEVCPDFCSFLKVKRCDAFTAEAIVGNVSDVWDFRGSMLGEGLWV